MSFAKHFQSPRTYSPSPNSPYLPMSFTSSPRLSSLVEEVETPATNKLGKFGGVNVKLGRRNTTAEVLERYEEEWKVAHKKIIGCRKVSFDIVLMAPQLK